MDYVFGTVYRNGREVEVVKTVGPDHSNLKGYCHVERRYPDNIITDTFSVVEKYASKRTTEACFDWYEITGHNRMMDKFTPAKGEIDLGIADSQDAICTLSEDVEERLAEIEDALCDLSKE